MPLSHSCSPGGGPLAALHLVGLFSCLLPLGRNPAARLHPFQQRPGSNGKHKTGVRPSRLESQACSFQMCAQLSSPLSISVCPARKWEGHSLFLGVRVPAKNRWCHKLSAWGTHDKQTICVCVLGGHVLVRCLSLEGPTSAPAQSCQNLWLRYENAQGTQEVNSG